MHTPLIAVIILAAVVAFDVFCLVSLVRAAEVSYLPKWVWAIIIIFISAPVGGIVYLAVGRSADRSARTTRLGPPDQVGAPDQVRAPEQLGPPTQFRPPEQLGPPTQFRPPEQPGSQGQRPGGLPPAAPGQSPAMIEVSQLIKRFGSVTALDGLSFGVRPGHVTGFLGPNGAGKTTAMRIILGLYAPTSGTALVGGRRYQEMFRPLHEVGSLLDASAVHGGRTAWCHLLSVAQSNGIGRRRVTEVLGLTGLDAVAGQRVKRFSLGMKQRLGIAGALLGDAPILVFDEPVNGLDPEGVHWIRQLFRSLAAEGRTVLVSSHLMSEMALTADHLIIIGRGRLLADMPADQFVESGTRRDVLVRSPRAGDLAALLTARGGTVTPEGDGGLAVTGLDAPAIADLAADRRIPVHELTPRHGSLEEAYLQLTGDSVEYRAGGPGQRGDKPTTTPQTAAGPAQPLSPAGPAQPLSPAGPAQPLSPAGSAQPLSPAGSAQPLPPAARAEPPSLAARAADVLSSEWTKFRSVRSTYWTLLIAAVTAIGGSAVLAFSARSTGRPPIDPIASIFVGWLEYPVLAVGILGVLTVTSEYGSGQILTTFTAVPQRLAVLAGKAVVTGIVTLIFGELLAFASFFLTEAILSGHRRGLSLSQPGVAGAVLAAGFALFVIAVAGLGLGAIIRHTAGAVAALPALIYLPLLVLILPSPWNDRIGRFTLLAAAAQLVSEHPRPGLLSPALSMLVLIAWPAAALLAAGFLITRRDA